MLRYKSCLLHFIMVVMRFVIISFAVITCLDAVDLPSYIKPCDLTDPNFDQCAIKSGQAAIPSLVKGDKKYKIPSLLPLEIPEIKFRTGDLHIKLDNAKVSGFENAQIKDFKFDPRKQHLAITVYIENANLISHYNIDGKILILPIRGDGAANITFGNMFLYLLYREEK
ncbi:hypothetical protein ILUMI_19804 [Ignelater luminosus]|uniref:Uncharacterized protein n=1 Tax=Ignelater luminosus TaxID=2038154 RepID=A0A8K0CHH7_IGNLU|nr:hypothetical protein ILUMI_19804 [Ignelater luminosus]